MRVVVDGFELQFDSVEDFEGWYSTNSHRLPEEPQIYYEDDDGNEMVRLFHHDEWIDYHVIDGIAVSDEDWEAYMNSGSLDLGDEIEDFEGWMNGEYSDEYDDGLPF